MPCSENPQIGQSMLQRFVTSMNSMAMLWLLLQRSQCSEQATHLRAGEPSHRSRFACHAAASELINASLLPQWGQDLRSQTWPSSTRYSAGTRWRHSMQKPSDCIDMKSSPCRDKFRMGGYTLFSPEPTATACAVYGGDGRRLPLGPAIAVAVGSWLNERSIWRLCEGAGGDLCPSEAEENRSHRIPGHKPADGRRSNDSAKASHLDAQACRIRA